LEDIVRARIATGGTDQLVPSARALCEPLARQLAVLGALVLVGVAGHRPLVALTAAATAVAFAVIGGALVVIRQRDGVDHLIRDGRDGADVLGLARRCRHLSSRRLRLALARGLRRRTAVRDGRVLAAYGALAARLESPEPVAPRGMVRLLELLRSAESAVPVGSPEDVVREVSAIRYLLEDRAADGCAC
jgi:hypothetical protein